MGEIGKSRSDSDREIYRQWERFHLPSTSASMCLFLIVGMSVTLVFDPILFGPNNPYSFLRILPISTAAISLFVVRRKILDSSSSIYLLRMLLLVPFSVLSLLYFHYLVVTTGEAKWIVLIGNFLVVIFSTIVQFRLRATLIAWAWISLLGAVGYQVAYPEFFKEIALIEISLLIAVTAALIMNASFVRTMAKEHRLVSMLVPNRAARAILTMDSEDSWAKAFQPRMRYSGCIVADWRGYQSMMMTVDPQKIQECFSLIYGAMLAALQEAIPEGTFYADWSADEIFIVIYDEQDRPDVVNHLTAKVAVSMATDIFERVVPLSGLPIIYDIGTSAGSGWLGLQGAVGMMKTTITARHAGVAKRLQTAAKDMRPSLEAEVRSPILFADHLISNEIQKVASQSRLKSISIKDAIRDVSKDEAVMAYCLENLKVTRVSMG